MLKINYDLPVGNPNRVTIQKDWNPSQISTKNPVNLFERKMVLPDDAETYGAADFASAIVCSMITDQNRSRMRNKARSM